jgi:predicted transcriptional regulator
MDDKILPVEEMIAYEEFTGRVEILRELDNWIKNIQRMAAPSTAIIAPRRMGKTVLLDRLVNTVFFKPEYKVAPFYFRMKREVITLRKFLLEYATTFYRQYIAYCLQDAGLYDNDEIQLEQLLSYQSDQRPVTMAQKSIKLFLDRYQKYDWHDARNHWEGFIHVPERLASHSGTRVAIIIDEFQDMKFYVYDLSEDALRTVKQERRQDPDMEGINLPATFYRLAQSKKAPMLVSGSAVTMIFKTVMGGPLSGRFDFTYLKPISITDGATLLHRLLKLYTDGKTISPENALYASTELEGHPYYLYCLTTSKIDKKKFESKAEIDRIIEYEIRHGKIYGFWQTHFDNNRRYINADDDEALGKKIIYYFTKYNNQPVDIEEIARNLKVSEKTVEQKIEKLYLADMVYRTANRFYSFNDVSLMRYIQFVYEKDWQDVDKISLSQQKKFDNLKGHFLEILVELTMKKFNYEQLDGTFFGRTGMVETPLFRMVGPKHVKGTTTQAYQIDVYGMEQDWRKNRHWLCECKYTQEPMNLEQVKKLERAAVAFKQEEQDAGRPEPVVQLWLVSTGGFAGTVQEYIKDREDIYFSDYEGINGVFQAFGGGFNIPIFKK